MLNAVLSIVYEDFASPALQLVPTCPSLRSCPQLTDVAWVSLGLQRAVQESPTGRGFLQTQGGSESPELTHYFHTLRSPRRLQLLRELNERVIRSVQEILPDELSVFPQLANFDVYAGDGHWHQAATHEPLLDERVFATGHFYALDLRRRTLSRLATGQGKKEHDMHVLKRLTKQALRQGAPTGRKVLYVWDKAGIDFRFWHNLKTTAAIYFISLEKENMDLKAMGQQAWDKADPLNHGILQDELVGSSNGVLLRRVTCQAPDTGQIRVFLTSEMTLPPGLIAHLYHRRWRIEKVFDCLKNKLNEKKSWSASPTAKAAQAEFLCLTHNLLRRLEETLASRDQVVNEPDVKRRAKRLGEQKALTQKAGRLWPSTWETLYKPVQYSVKLIRWLRKHLTSRLDWTAALADLRGSYAKL